MAWSGALGPVPVPVPVTPLDTGAGVGVTGTLDEETKARGAGMAVTGLAACVVASFFVCAVGGLCVGALAGRGAAAGDDWLCRSA